MKIWRNLTKILFVSHLGQWTSENKSSKSREFCDHFSHDKNHPRCQGNDRNLIFNLKKVMPHPRVEVLRQIPTAGTDKMTNAPGGIGTLGIDWTINNSVHSHLPLFKHLLSDFIKGQLNVLNSVIFLFFFQLPFEANYCLKNSIMMTSADRLQNRIVNCKAHCQTWEGWLPDKEAQYRKRFRQTANVNKFVSRDKAFALLDVHCSLLLLICLQSNATLTNKNRLIQFLSTYFSIFRN